VSVIHLLADGEEIARRRGRAPKDSVIEAWGDLYLPGLYWLGERSKAVLDALGPPLAAQLSIPAGAVPVYYGPQLCDLESLPTEESLRSRVLSAHGIAVAWITLDRFGQRTSHTPASPLDAAFHLRRLGGGAGHLWRLFTTRKDAADYLGEHYGRDAEALEWADKLPAESFDALVARYTSGR
jgi:hypothetical protein